MTKLLPLFLLLCLIGVLGCGTGQDGVVTDFNESRMDAAILEAKSSLDSFRTALKANEPGSEDFALKKGFGSGDDNKEFIWLNEIKEVDGGFQGSVNNDPVYDVGVKLGDTVKFSRDEVADWMYFKDGELVGGYTIVALVYESPEEDTYKESMGIDYSKYKFLQD